MHHRTIFVLRVKKYNEEKRDVWVKYFSNVEFLWAGLKK